MFTWLNNQGVKSDKGFIVQCVSRFTFEYQEGTKILTINVETDFLEGRKPLIIVKKMDFTTWDHGINISEEKIDRIISNFIAALDFQGINVEVE